MVKIINGEIVEDHDPRVRSLLHAQQQHLVALQQQQHFAQQHQQPAYPPQQQYFPYPPYGYYSPYAYQQLPPPHQLPIEYQQYYQLQQQQQQQHHSPFSTDESLSERPDGVELGTEAAAATGSSTHLAPPSPALTAQPTSALSHRRLSFSSAPLAATPSPSASSCRLSFSTLHPPPPSQPLSTSPLAPTRRLSLSSPSPLSHPPPPLPHSAAGSAFVPHHAHAPPPPPASLYPRRHPSSYNLFGLPSITIAEISVRPHVYLLAALLLYFIGPPVLVPLLAAFFFYRWHLAQEEATREKERVELKFSAFRHAKTRPRTDSGAARIHSLRDIQG